MLAAQLATVCAPALLFTVWSAPLVNDGGSFTELTVIVKVCGAEVSTPPFAVPPLSLSKIVIVAEPFAFVAGMKLNAPFELTVGADENRLAFVLPVTWKVSVCPDSSAGPAEILM